MAATVAEAYFRAFQKLVEVYGQDDAEEIVSQAKKLARLDSVLMPNDLYKLGCVLQEHDGLAGTVGTTLCTQAFLLEAKDADKD